MLLSWTSPFLRRSPLGSAHSIARGKLGFAACFGQSAHAALTARDLGGLARFAESATVIRALGFKRQAGASRRRVSPQRRSSRPTGASWKGARQDAVASAPVPACASARSTRVRRGLGTSAFVPPCPLPAGYRKGDVPQARIGRDRQSMGRAVSPKSSHASRDAREGAWDHSLDTGRPAATTITALLDGLAVEELTDPGAVPDELFGQLIVRPLSGQNRALIAPRGSELLLPSRDLSRRLSTAGPPPDAATFERRFGCVPR